MLSINLKMYRIAFFIRKCVGVFTFFIIVLSAYYIV